MLFILQILIICNGPDMPEIQNTETQGPTVIFIDGIETLQADQADQVWAFFRICNNFIRKFHIKHYCF
jgi:hypothetical protein